MNLNKKTNLKSIRIIFFGTPEFALPALLALHQAGCQIAAVITQPDKPTGRKQITTSSPIKIAATKLKIKVLTELNEADIYQLKPTLGIVVAYGKIIPERILKLFPLGCLNIHPSLLPKYRGPSPIQSAILAGDETTGVSIIKLDDKMDHGPIVAAEEVKINRSDARELSNRLAATSARLLLNILPDYIDGKLELHQQSDHEAVFCKLLTRTDGKIDWRKSAAEIARQIRAYSAWPESSAEVLLPDSKKLSVKISAAHETNQAAAAEHGSVFCHQGDLFIKCSQGALLIKKIQPAGKNELTAGQFINGYLKN